MKHNIVWCSICGNELSEDEKPDGTCKQCLEKENENV